jgi:hypothetical protein
VFAVCGDTLGSSDVTGWPSPRSLDGGLDEVPLPHPAGRLWLCGKHLVGPDPDAALSRAGASTVVCLNQEHELRERYPHYVAWLRHHQHDRAVWHPVPDLHAPELDEMLGLLRRLRTRLDEGESLLAHCGAGIGRAGTLAACLLISMGSSAQGALALVARSRPTAGPEAGAQQELVDAVARHFGT